MSTWSIAQANLTSVGVLAFLLGLLGSKLKSDLRLPEPIYAFLSIYLLFGIGLKGGHSLKTVSFADFLAPGLVTLVCGVLIPVAAFFSLKLIRALSDVDRGSIAAHYGSTSLVTFSAALLFMESNNIFVEGFAPALLTLLEVPGLIVGIYLANSSREKKNVDQGPSVSWLETLKEVLLGKTILLLVGGMFIGFITSDAGFAKVRPLFIDLLTGLLALFLLHLGYLAGTSSDEIKRVGWRLGLFAIVFPLGSGFVGTLTGNLVGLSIGGATILGVLAASASYIAAPAAVSIALPRANLSLALMSSVGITFPFNLILGIPIYYEFAVLFN